jgi:protein-tyrosine phosphatase
MGATHSLIDLERDAVIALMKTINRRLVRECIPQYRSFLQILLREEAYPLVFHCTAGKDRTGFAGALLLNILGVDSATVMSDYLLSNDFQRPPADLPSNLQPMYHVRREYLEAAFDEITEQYGNMEVYLSIALGCLSESDIKKLRELLTE